MILGFLLAALPASATGTAEHGSQPALVEAFRMFCMAGEASGGALESAAIAAGFKPVPVSPKPGWNENAAWQRSGVRVFNLTPGTDSTAPALCGVSGKIGRLGEDDALLDPVAAMADSAFIEGNGGRPHSGWLIAGKKKFVRVSIDRTDQADVGVVLLAQPWPGEAAK